MGGNTGEIQIGSERELVVWRRKISQYRHISFRNAAHRITYLCTILCVYVIPLSPHGTYIRLFYAIKVWHSSTLRHPIKGYVCMYVCMYGHHMQQSMDQPGKVANPARGQLNRGNEYSPVPVNFTVYRSYALYYAKRPPKQLVARVCFPRDPNA